MARDGKGNKIGHYFVDFSFSIDVPIPVLFSKLVFNFSYCHTMSIHKLQPFPELPKAGQKNKIKLMSN